MEDVVQGLAAECQPHRWDVFTVGGHNVLVVVGPPTAEAAVLMDKVGERLCQRLTLEVGQHEVDDGE